MNCEEEGGDLDAELEKIFKECSLIRPKSTTMRERETFDRAIHLR